MSIWAGNERISTNEYVQEKKNKIEIVLHRAEENINKKLPVLRQYHSHSDNVTPFACPKKI